MNTALTLTRPILRYHGSKWRLAPWILEHFPAHRFYTEAYGGGASVLLRKRRCYSEVYNDLDGEIVNVFRVLRNPTQARELERLVRLTPYSRDEFVQAYLPDGDPVEQARKTLIKSFMGYGSDGITGSYGTGFRANVKRSYTIPAHDWMRFPDQIPLFAGRLQGVIVENRPALEVLAQYDDARALHYVDPPYPFSTRTRQDVHRYRYEMTDEEHRELSGVLHQVKGCVVVSGYSCKLYDELYADWKRVEKTGLAYADSETERTEVLWVSPNTQSCASQKSLF